MRAITTRERGAVGYHVERWKRGARVQEQALTRLAGLLAVEMDTALDALNGCESVDDFMDRIGVETFDDSAEPGEPGWEFATTTEHEAFTLNAQALEAEAIEYQRQTAAMQNVLFSCICAAVAGCVAITAWVVWWL